MTPLLHLKQLVCGRTQGLHAPLDLELRRGERLGIIGSNGAGKSTLLKTLLGLIRPYSGSYLWQRPCRLGYLPQESEIDELFPFSVRDVLEMGGYGLARRAQAQGLQRVVERLRLDSLLGRFFRELSGGERQRVLLGRALLGSPDALLLDEPLHSLDYPIRRQMWQTILELQLQFGFSLVIIEHDLNTLINDVDQFIILGTQRSWVRAAKSLGQEAILSEIFSSPLHVHSEDGRLQVHFL